MVDYISSTKHFTEKDNPFLGYCEHQAYYKSGWHKYWLQGCEKLEVWYNPSLKLIRLQGSIMYYIQGHNFTYNKADFVKAIDFISTLLKLPLWNSSLEIFEYGIIMNVELKPSEYIQHHVTERNELFTYNNEKDKGNLKGWNDKNVRLKMYDAGRNIQYKQGLNRKEIIKEAGWNPELNFLKWEAHYLKPEVLNSGKELILADLVNPYWEDIFKEDLYLQYKRLIPMKSIVIPNNKKDLSTSDIIMLALAEEQLNEGTTLQEVKKMLYARINSLPNEILSKADKDSRKRQIKILLDKIKEEDISKWDLSEKLVEALKINQ